MTQPTTPRVSLASSPSPSLLVSVLARARATTRSHILARTDSRCALSGGAATSSGSWRLQIPGSMGGRPPRSIQPDKRLAPRRHLNNSVDLGGTFMCLKGSL